MAIVGASSLSRVFNGKGTAGLPRWSKPAVDTAPLAELPLPTPEQIDAIRAQAYAEGFQRGEQAGLAAGRADIARKLGQLDALFERFARPYSQLEDRVERELTLLACDIARQLTRRELGVCPDLIADTVREALLALPGSARDLVVYLNPDDVALIGTLPPLDGIARDWRTVSDPALARGDCRLTGGEASIDASLRARLDGIVTRLLGADATTDL